MEKVLEVDLEKLEREDPRLLGECRQETGGPSPYRQRMETPLPSRKSPPKNVTIPTPRHLDETSDG